MRFPPIIVILLGVVLPILYFGWLYFVPRIKQRVILNPLRLANFRTLSKGFSAKLKAEEWRKSRQHAQNRQAAARVVAGKREFRDSR